MRTADRVFGIDPDARASQLAKLYFLTLIFSGGAGVLAAGLLRRLALRLGCSERASELTAFAYAFGTLVFPFSTALFGHQLAAVLLLGAVVLMVEARDEGRLREPRVLVALGALWATTLVVEYPTALLVAVFGTTLLVWTFERARPLATVRTLLFAAAGGALPMIVHVAFLFWAYGKLALPYTYVSEPYFRAHMSGGFLGIGIPEWIATYGTLFSPYRGILFYCPVLVLSVAGLGAWLASGRAMHLLVVLVPAYAIYLLFAFSYYAWDGGGSTGPRHLLPLLPYVMLPIAFFADRSRLAFGVTLIGRWRILRV